MPPDRTAMRTHFMHFLGEKSRLAAAYSCLLVAACCLPAGSGCTRAYYRQQADGEAYELIHHGSQDPRWQLDRYNIYADPRSRMADPYCPDYEPMPPDDPVSHQLMHCVNCKKGWPCWHMNGDTPLVQNPGYRDYLPYNDKGNVELDMQAVMQVALLNSRAYQQNLEELYLSALDVSFERFRFDTQFFAGNDTFFEVRGNRTPTGGFRPSSSLLTNTTDARASRLFTTGGTLLVDFANTFMWQFSGDGSEQVNTLLSFAFAQPLLRAGGRQVVMERLTRAERLLLGNIRAMQRYRQEFYVNLAVGRDTGQGPSRQGGFLGGAGLEGFAGVGGGGFGRVGATGGAGGAAGGGAGFGGQAGAAGAGGFLGLLQRNRQIENQRANVEGLRESLELLEALYAANRIDRLQVDQARLALFAAQSNLLTAETAYESTLDSYKITLGLPPDLQVEIKDPRLDQFELLSPEMIDLQTEAGIMVARLWSLPNPEEANQSGLSTDDPFVPAKGRLTGDLEVVDSALGVLKLAQYLVPVDQNHPYRVLRDRFRLYEARLESLRSILFRTRRGLEQIVNAPNSLILAEKLQARAQELLPGVNESMERLQEQRDDRISNLRLLAQRDEVRQGKVDPRAFDVEAFEQRANELPAGFELIRGRLELDPSRWRVLEGQLRAAHRPAEQLVNQLDQLLREFRPIIEMLEIELAKPARDELPADLKDLIAQLNRFVDDPRMELARIEQGLAELEALLERVNAGVDQLSEDASNIGLLQARARLDSSTLTPVSLKATQAIQIAEQNRLDWMNARAQVVDQWRLIEFNANALEAVLNVVLDGDINTLGDNPFRFRAPTGRLRGGVQFDAPITRLGERNQYRQTLIEFQQARRGYVQFEDSIYLGLRNTLRTIELNQVNFELRRAAVRTALDQVELSRLRLQEPPRPTALGAAVGPATLGATTVRDLVDALASLLGVQNDYLSFWVNYEVQRLGLDLDLGTMQLDDRGMWMDPGPVDGTKMGTGGEQCNQRSDDQAPAPPAEEIDAPEPATTYELPPAPTPRGLLPRNSNSRNTMPEPNNPRINEAHNKGPQMQPQHNGPRLYAQPIRMAKPERPASQTLR